MASQRAYAAGTVIWAAAILFVILADLWRPWYSPIFNGGWSSTEDHQVVQTEPFIPPPLESNLGPAPSPTPSDVLDSFLAKQQERQMQQRRIRSFLWTVGLALIPPTMGYVLLFYVVPWIYRGFNPRTQNAAERMFAAQYVAAALDGLNEGAKASDTNTTDSKKKSTD